MRHRKSGRKLRRKTASRRALLRSVVRGLFLAEPDEDQQHMERIITTPAKAKEARRLAERIITLGKRGDLAARRRVTALLDDRKAVKKVFDTIAPRYADRPGGYTRILHWHENRLGDNAPQVLFELVEAEMKSEEEHTAPTAPDLDETATEDETTGGEDETGIEDETEEQDKTGGPEPDEEPDDDATDETAKDNPPVEDDESS